MTQVANDRIAQRAKVLFERKNEARLAKERQRGAEMARAWLAAGPVKAGVRIRLSRADREALIGMENVR